MTRQSDTRGLVSRTGIRGLFAAALVFSVFTNILMLTGPLFMLQVYDRVLGSRSEETLVALFGLVAVLFLFYGILDHARGRVMARAGARIQTTLDTRVLQRLLMRAARRDRPSEATLQDVDALRTLFGAPVILALFDIPWTPLFLLAIFLFHPLLGWLALAGGGVLILLAIANQLRTASQLNDSVGGFMRARHLSEQARAAAELVWAQGMAGAVTTRWARLNDDALAKTLLANDRTGLFGSAARAFRFFLQSAILALGAWLVLQDELTAGAMIASSILLGRALAPVETGIAQWAVVQRARTGWTNLRALLAEDADQPPRTELPAPAAELSLRGVSVVFGKGVPPTLHGISFTLCPGEAIGVIGRSGSGKTTLARVVLGIVPPTAGEMRLSGATLDQYGPETLGCHVGYVPQDVRLFDGTVAENIAQLAAAPDDARVVEAARRAHVHDIILKLPQGYDTRIGMDDAQLSGGQKQRLALARALYNDPVLLVLDEPNSALDAEGSEALNTVVTAMKTAGKGVILMTHRPTAITSCDKLLVLDNGRAAGFGPRDEILRSLLKNADEVRRAIGGTDRG